MHAGLHLSAQAFMHFNVFSGGRRFLRPLAADIATGQWFSSKSLVQWQTSQHLPGRLDWIKADTSGGQIMGEWGHKQIAGAVHLRSAQASAARHHLPLAVLHPDASQMTTAHQQLTPLVHQHQALQSGE